ncbi:hypothetical protein TUM1887_47990 (plasmid) [Escherichia coli]|nr:hypothetical protein TUM1887_47990 [Escherichia coli]
MQPNAKTNTSYWEVAFGPFVCLFWITYQISGLSSESIVLAHKFGYLDTKFVINQYVTQYSRCILPVGSIFVNQITSGLDPSIHCVF